MTKWPVAARAFVETARIARLATADRNAVPHVVPICFVLERDDLYSIVDAKPKRRPTSMKRLRNIGENPHVSVLVDRWDEDWSRLAWSMLTGTAALVTDSADYTRAVTALRGKYPQYESVSFAIATNPLLRVRVERVLWWTASPPPA